MTMKSPEKKTPQAIKSAAHIETIRLLIGMYHAAGCESTSFHLMGALWDTMRSRVPVSYLELSNDKQPAIKVGKTYVYRETREYCSYERLRFYRKLKFGEDF
jgi:hypothetical protein